tara:strand:- start:11743 stop:12102 length:360 start_codon:yes stop_codon:yes gene_type:complete
MPTRYEGKKSEGSHKMKDGSVMSGKTHTKDSKVVKKAPSKKPKMAEADIDGEKIKFKEGALHKQLKTPEGYTFKKAELEKMKKVENGDMLEFLGKKIKMTPLLKRRVTFALVLMRGKKK